MANRYYSFQELSEIPVQEKTKAPGTLGKHHFIILKKNPNRILVAGYSSDDQEVNQTTVKAGGTLGYDRGHLWAIKPLHEMSPLERLRAEFKISKKNVFILPAQEYGAVEVEGLTDAPGIADSPFANHNRFWGSGETWALVGENFKVSYIHSFHGGVDQRTRIGRIFIRKENSSLGIKQCYEALKNR